IAGADAGSDGHRRSKKDVTMSGANASPTGRSDQEINAPAFTDILDAKRVIDRYLQPTPLHHYPRLSSELGFDVFIKHENHQPVGAFKVRGGINLISRLSAEEKKAGVITASTGNHGQSIAYASRLFGVKAIIGVPEGANLDTV